MQSSLPFCLANCAKVIDQLSAASSVQGAFLTTKKLKAKVCHRKNVKF